MGTPRRPVTCVIVASHTEEKSLRYTYSEAKSITMLGKQDQVNAAEVKYSRLFFPIIALALFLGLWSSPALSLWRWFDWHPLTMSLGFVGLASLAVLKKRVGGKGPTVQHGNMANAGVLFGIAGWYVIYSNKEMLGKQHLTSLHGKLGAASLVSFIILGLVGALGLHPDFGKVKTHTIVRKVHKYSGRAALLLSWSAAFTGFIKFESSLTVQVPVVVALSALSYFTLL